MLVLKLLLFASLLLIFYNYAGYALLVFLINKWQHRRLNQPAPKQSLPSVSFIVAAYNEEDCIEKRFRIACSKRIPDPLNSFLLQMDRSTIRPQLCNPIKTYGCCINPNGKANLPPSTGLWQPPVMKF